MPNWLREELLQVLGEVWVADNLDACLWTAKPNRLWVPGPKVELIYREAAQVLEHHNIKVTGTDRRRR